MVAQPVARHALHTLALGGATGDYVLCLAVTAGIIGLVLPATAWLLARRDI